MSHNLTHIPQSAIRIPQFHRWCCRLLALSLTPGQSLGDFLPMKIFHGTDNAGIARGTVLTLGVFDGLHLGHQKIMETVVTRAAAIGAVPTAITFDPHPRAVLHPDNAPPLLQTLDQRLANFEFLGIEQAIVIRFGQAQYTVIATLKLGRSVGGWQ